MLPKKLCALAVLMQLALCLAAHGQQYTGHDGVARLRGFNVNNATTSSNFPALTSFGANVVRYELTYSSAFPSYSSTVDSDMSGGTGDVSSSDLASYHAWAVWEATNSSSDLNTCITYCAAHNIKVLLDMHYPAGGSMTSGSTRIFMYSDDETEFLNDWTLFAQTYAGNSTVWGYDLCNEPHDASSSAITTWNSLDLAAANNIRAYDSAGGSDPQHALIVEICDEGFPGLTPLTSVNGVVYSFHTYADESYSFYGWDPSSPAGSQVWPDTSWSTTGLNWDWDRRDITQLYSCVMAARTFQLANNCQIFVGEFDCVRWAPGSAEWMTEFINMFESYGWDWTFLDFRPNGFNGWDSEVGPSTGPSDPYISQTTAPFLPKTDMKTVLTSWFTPDNMPITNCNFMTPSEGTGGPNYNYGPSGATWTFNSRSGLCGNGSYFNNPNSVAGTQCAFLQSASSTKGLISQSLQWMPYTSYYVTFKSAYRSGYPQQTIYVYTGGTISGGVLSGGTLVGTITPLTTSWDTYTTLPFQVGTGSLPVTSALTFVGAATTGDQTAFIDDVSVSEGSPSMMPLGDSFLTGANINDGSTPTSVATPALAAFDNNVLTYYSSSLASGGWTGIDLGAGKTATLTHVYFYPRSDVFVDPNGGQFQGSNNLTSWTTLATITNDDGNYGQVLGARQYQICQIPVLNAAPYRYFRFYGAANTNCTIGEVKFFGNMTSFITDGSEAGSTTPPRMAFDGNYATNFESLLSAGGWTGIDLGSACQAAVYQVSYYPDGTPSKMVGGVFQGSNNNSTWTNLAPAISSTPASGEWTTIITTPETSPYPLPYPLPYRYFRYYNANSGNSGVAGIQFYGDQAHVLTGTNINDAWGATWGNPPANAYDGNTTTCYDSNLGSGGWTGIDLGAANPGIVTSISYYPDSAWGGGPAQMVGGEFQGSNDEVTWTNLAPQITSTPAISTWTTVQATNLNAYRYLRYYDNGSGSNYCNVAEVQFNGY